MDSSLQYAILILAGSLAIVALAAGFLIWAAVYFGRRAYRRVTRRSLYVPVEAWVIRIGDNGRYGATLHLEYSVSGTKITNRLLTTHPVARAAQQQAPQMPLLVDPHYPSDAVVDPAFQAAATNAAPVYAAEPLGATSFKAYAVRLLCCVLGGASIACGVVWVRQGTLDTTFIVGLATVLSTVYALLLLIAFSWFKTRDAIR